MVVRLRAEDDFETDPTAEGGGKAFQRRQPDISFAFLEAGYCRLRCFKHSCQVRPRKTERAASFEKSTSQLAAFDAPRSGAFLPPSGPSSEIESPSLPRVCTPAAGARIR